ncbi:hypothetical protein [Parapedobacter tibetensis]|uniref:hypothetical protein n=1 Tax=Parapedobacter tibetensis TaxID=2972951 RepID=UPI00214D8690|nr:hypothetical protein [Parapedobacter tibetensis]
MKSIVLVAVLLTACFLSSTAQIRAKKEVDRSVVNADLLKAAETDAPTFSRSEQAQIAKILGRDFVPVFNEKGELSIATQQSVRHVKALGGGFSKNPGSVASNILIHKGWVLATSKDVLEAMKSQLGAQRFQQLEAIVSK